MQVIYFLNAPMFSLLLLSYIEKKCFLKKNLAIILPLKSKSSSILLMKVSKFKKIVDFSKASIKMKIFKTFYELKTATASRLKYSELIIKQKLPTSLKKSPGI